MKQFRCYKCCDVPYFAPVLKDSGYSRPRDLVCGVCNMYYDSVTGEVFDVKKYQEQEARREAIRNYNNQWFGN